MKTLKYGKLIAIAFIFLSSVSCRTQSKDAKNFTGVTSQQTDATKEYFSQIICADPECKLKCITGKVELNKCFKTNANESQKVTSCSGGELVVIVYHFADSCQGFNETEHISTGKCSSMVQGKDAFRKFECE